MPKLFSSSATAVFEIAGSVFNRCSVTSLTVPSASTSFTRSAAHVNAGSDKGSPSPGSGSWTRVSPEGVPKPRSALVTVPVPVPVGVPAGVSTGVPVGVPSCCSSVSPGPTFPAVAPNRSATESATSLPDRFWVLMPRFSATLFAVSASGNSSEKVSPCCRTYGPMLSRPRVVSSYCPVFWLNVIPVPTPGPVRPRNSSIRTMSA